MFSIIRQIFLVIFLLIMKNGTGNMFVWKLEMVIGEEFQIRITENVDLGKILEAGTDTRMVC